MKDQNLINENELYLVDGSEIDKYTFTATAGQNTFTIPFEFDGSSSLTLYYNGVMMKENDNYTIAGNVITLVDWTAEEGDYITVMGIQGAAAIDFAKDADKYMKQMEDKATEVKADLTATVTTAKNDITSTASTSKTEINTIISTGKNDLNNLISTLPDNWNNVMDKNSANVMGANGKITMDNSYVPSGDNDIITKKYVNNYIKENSYKVGDTLTTARTDLGEDWLLCNGASVDNSINIYNLLSTEDYSKLEYWTQYFGKKNNSSSDPYSGSYLYSDFVQYLNGYYFYTYTNSNPRWTYNTEGPVSSNRTEINKNTNYFILSLETSKDILFHNGNYYGFSQEAYVPDSSVDYYYYNLKVSPKLINTISSDVSTLTLNLGAKREWYNSLFILNDKILWAGNQITTMVPLTSYTLTSLNNNVSYGPYNYGVYQLDDQLFAISVNSTNRAELDFYNLNNNISFSYTLTDGSIFYAYNTLCYTYKSNGDYYFYALLEKDSERTSYALFKLNKETNKLDFVRIFNQLNKSATSTTKHGTLQIFGDITLNNKNYVLFNSNNLPYITDNLFGISSITEAISLPIGSINKYPILDANNKIYINTNTGTTSPLYKRYLPTISSPEPLYTYIKAK